MGSEMCIRDRANREPARRRELRSSYRWHGPRSHPNVGPVPQAGWRIDRSARRTCRCDVSRNRRHCRHVGRHRNFGTSPIKNPAFPRKAGSSEPATSFFDAIAAGARAVPVADDLAAGGLRFHANCLRVAAEMAALGAQRARAVAIHDGDRWLWIPAAPTTTEAVISGRAAAVHSDSCPGSAMHRFPMSDILPRSDFNG